MSDRIVVSYCMYLFGMTIAALNSGHVSSGEASEEVGGVSHVESSVCETADLSGSAVILIVGEGVTVCVYCDGWTELVRAVCDVVV